MPATELGKTSIAAAVSSGGIDDSCFGTGSDVYCVTGKDSMLSIASVWNRTEFNVVGDAGGSEAELSNSGSKISLQTTIWSNGGGGSISCVANAGTTGETNNLNLGSCTSNHTSDISFS